MSEHKEKTQHANSDSEPLITRSMLNHISPAQKDKYSRMLKADGNVLLGKQKYKEAIEVYTTGIAFKPDDQALFFNRSACHIFLQNHQNVIEDTTAALKLKPDFQTCLTRRAAAYEALENYEAAVFDWLCAALYLPDDLQKSREFISFKRCMRLCLLRTVDEMEEKRGLQLPPADHIHEALGGFDKELTVEGLPEDPSKLEEGSGDFYLISGMKKLYVKDSNRYIEADGLFTKALDAYKKDYSVDMGNNVLKRKLAVAYEYVGLFKELKTDPTSIAHFKTAINLNPKRVRTLVMNAFFLSERDLLSESKSMLDKALKLAPKSGEAHFHKGLLFEKMYVKSQIQTDLDLTHSHYKKAKIYRPDNVLTLIKLMKITLAMGDGAEYRKLESWGKEKFSRSPEFANFIGEIFRLNDDWIGAMGQFQLSIMLGDISSGSSIRVIQTANAAGQLLNAKTSTELDLEAAKELLEKAVKIDPRSDIAKLPLGHLLLNQGKDDEAAALYKEAATLCPVYESRLLVTGMAFSRDIDFKLKRIPELYKKFRALNMSTLLPSLTLSSPTLTDIFSRG